MFKNLTSFGYRRTTKEAFGFYLAYLLLYIVVGGFTAAVAAFVGGTGGFSNGFALGVRVGSAAVALLSVGISLGILRSKNALGFGRILLSLLAGFLSLGGGGVLGLIVPACFTTLPSPDAAASEDLLK
jgi:hypothetical protein